MPAGLVMSSTRRQPVWLETHLAQMLDLAVLGVDGGARLALPFHLHLVVHLLRSVNLVLVFPTHFQL